MAGKRLTDEQKAQVLSTACQALGIGEVASIVEADSAVVQSFLARAAREGWSTKIRYLVCAREDCQETLVTPGRRKYCSDACARRAEREAESRKTVGHCGVCGAALHRGNKSGFCRQHPPNTRRPTPGTEARECARNDCGERFSSAITSQRFCSASCRARGEYEAKRHPCATRGCAVLVGAKATYCNAHSVTHAGRAYRPKPENLQRLVPDPGEYETLEAWLRAIVVQLPTDARELAAWCGLSWQALELWIRNPGVSPSLEAREKLRVALGVSPQLLAKWRGSLDEFADDQRKRIRDGLLGPRGYARRKGHAALSDKRRISNRDPDAIERRREGFQRTLQDPNRRQKFRAVRTLESQNRRQLLHPYRPRIRELARQGHNPHHIKDELNRWRETRLGKAGADVSLPKVHYRTLRRVMGDMGLGAPPRGFATPQEIKDAYEIAHAGSIEALHTTNKGRRNANQHRQEDRWPALRRAYRELLREQPGKPTKTAIGYRAEADRRTVGKWMEADADWIASAELTK